MLKILLLMLTSALLLGQASAPLTVPWLPMAPVLDGVLDPGLETLPEVTLKAEDGGPGQVRLRWGADAEALYVHLSSDQATLAARDRAYQNGDGLILVLATPEGEGAPTRRFRVLGFSPQAEDRRNWQFAFTWYRDLDLQMTPLPGVRCQWRLDRTALTLELRIPWTALAPYHPLLTPRLGLNACFVRAEGDQKRRFLWKEDPAIQSEQRPRAYVPVTFAPPPQGLPAVAWFARPALGHVVAGAPLPIAVGTSAPLALRVRLLEGEGGGLGGPRELRAPAGAHELPLEGPPLPPGAYQVEIQGPGQTLSWGLTVFPEGGTQALQRRFERMASRLAPGLRSTLAFRLQDARERLAALTPTDPAPTVRRLLQQVQEDLQALEEGRDPLAPRPGLLRRAYRSALDQTLQPYTLRVPGPLVPERRYPLLVYLHGSGQSDQGVLDLRRAPEDWFELAPLGRGTSNCYSADHAQDDLREAIDDVLAHYPVDPSRIVLAGFSMGGYGVYRTAFERPGLFRGLAIFSGVPDLATRWLGPGHPDFLDAPALRTFKDLPVFIFHGTADLNCPFGKTDQLVGLLKEAGAQVTFVVEEGKGHEYPAPSTMARYLQWLATVGAER
jgi:predicted esterase